MLTAGVIGWPVAHSKSPLIHRFWLAKLGLDGDYSRFAVHPDNLGAAIRALPALGIAGVNVTVPHKVAAMAHLDHLYDSATVIGAVNVIKILDDGRLVGANTDADGFIAPLHGLPLGEMRAVLVGAGGAARAALFMLDLHGCTLSVRNRTPARAAALIAGLAIERPVAIGGLDAPLGPVDLVVNASSLGMTGQPPLDLDLAALPATAIVYDMVYAPLETPLLAAARARGLRTIDGLAMLIGQAAAAFEMFFSQHAPREHDAELRALLTA